MRRIFGANPRGCGLAALVLCGSMNCLSSSIIFNHFPGLVRVVLLALCRVVVFLPLQPYASYARLSEDGLTQWHPAFLTLDECSTVSQLLPAISPGDQAQAAGHEWLGKPGAPPASQETWVRATRFTLLTRIRVPGNGAPIPPGHGCGRPCLGPGPGPCWCGGPAQKPLISGCLRSILSRVGFKHHHPPRMDQLQRTPNNAQSQRG